MNLDKYYESHYPWDFCKKQDERWNTIQPSSVEPGFSSLGSVSPKECRYSDIKDHQSSGNRYLSSEKNWSPPINTDHYSLTEHQCSRLHNQLSSSEKHNKSADNHSSGQSQNQQPVSSTGERYSFSQGRKQTNEKRRWYPASGRIYHSRVNLYKTELCRMFDEKGFCDFGSGCKFAHGPSELRFVVRHPRYRTRLCKSYHETGLCNYNKRCFFIHDDNEDKVSVLLSAIEFLTGNFSSSNLSALPLTHDSSFSFQTCGSNSSVSSVTDDSCVLQTCESSVLSLTDDSSDSSAGDLSVSLRGLSFSPTQ